MTAFSSHHRARMLPLAAALLLAGTASAQEPGGSEGPPPLPQAGAATQAPADETKKKADFVAALTGGVLAVKLNYRYEIVDDEAVADNAYASTLRTTLGYTTGAFHGFKVYLEAENVTDIGAGDLHNDAGRGDRGNGITGRPVIADPSGTDFLQAGMEWSGADTLVRAGRQEIVLDDARFVGNVGWRQHHQSFRAIRARNASLGNFTANYAYVDRVYRIFGDRQDTGTHLINAQYDFGAVGTLTGYAYLLRYDDEALYGLSTDSFGGEFKGRAKIDDTFALRYEAEYAVQHDAGDNPRRIDADYLHGLLGVDIGKFGLLVAYEKLGGSLRDGQFNTPMATLHGFNGWADKFLTTPATGLQDLHVWLNGPLGPVNWALRYHDFKADAIDVRYGNEFDFQLTWTAPWKQGFLFGGAIYDADAFSTDTSKFWLQTTYSF